MSSSCLDTLWECEESVQSSCLGLEDMGRTAEDVCAEVLPRITSGLVSSAAVGCIEMFFESTDRPMGSSVVLWSMRLV